MKKEKKKAIIVDVQHEDDEVIPVNYNDGYEDLETQR